MFVGSRNRNRSHRLCLQIPNLPERNEKYSLSCSDWSQKWAQDRLAPYLCAEEDLALGLDWARSGLYCWTSSEMASMDSFLLWNLLRPPHLQSRSVRCTGPVVTSFRRSFSDPCHGRPGGSMVWNDDPVQRWWEEPPRKAISQVVTLF